MLLASILPDILFREWFIHFWMDVVIFSSLALGAVSPGG